MSTNTPDFNDKLAKVMANTAVATKEEASRALEESGGSVSGAITLLLVDQQPSAKEEADSTKNEAMIPKDVGKEDLQYAPSISTGRNNRGKGNKYSVDESLKRHVIDKKGTQNTPRVARPISNSRGLVTFASPDFKRAKSSRQQHEADDQSTMKPETLDAEDVLVKGATSREMNKESENLKIGGKDDLQYAPSISVGRGGSLRCSRTQVAKSPPTLSKGDEYRVGGLLKTNDLDKKILQYAPSLARRSNSRHKNDDLKDTKRPAVKTAAQASRDGEENQYRVAKLSDQDELEINESRLFDDTEIASNLEEGTATDNLWGLPRPREPVRTVKPGAFHDDGRNARDVVAHDDGDWTDDEESKAELMEVTGEMYDPDEENRQVEQELDRRVEEELNRKVRQELEEMQQNVVIGEVVAVADHENEEGQKESFWNSKRNHVTIVVGVLACVAIVLGVVLSQSRDSPDDEPTAAPTMAPTSLVDVVTGLILSVSFDNGAALETSNTPQSRALDWLVNNNITNLESYSDEKIIQRYALATLYYSTNGDDWRSSIGWLTDEDECEWRRISLCTRRILDMTRNNLVGTVPPEIGLLSNSLGKGGELRLLENDLVGKIPSELGLMTSLNWLGLHVNNLTGTIPSELGVLTSLSLLTMNNNSLTGTIPSELRLMTSLTTLHLFSNNLIGTVSSELGALTSLTFLNLCCNSLTGTIPSKVGLMTSLSSLNLWDNNLTGTIPSELGFLSSLTWLGLSRNNLTGTIPSELGVLKEWLFTLSLNHNSLTGTIPSELGLIRGLKGLYLNNNKLTGTIPNAVFGARLTSFDLKSNAFSGTIPSELGLLAGASTKLLDICCNSLTGTIPSELGLLMSLTLLSLDNNNLTGTIPSELGLMERLEGLLLHGNKLTGTIPSAVIGALTRLTSLNLKSNILTGTMPSELGLLTRLTSLDLCCNSLTGTIPSELGLLTSLTLLSLDNNNLTGTIPSDFGLNPNLTRLLLYDKQ